MTSMTLWPCSHCGTWDATSPGWMDALDAEAAVTSPGPRSPSQTLSSAPPRSPAFRRLESFMKSIIEFEIKAKNLVFLARLLSKTG